MNQRQVNDVIRRISKQVNPAGTYIPGQQSDGSIWYDAPGDHILNTTTSSRKSVNNALTTVRNIVMIFSRQDSLANVAAAEYDNTINPNERDPGAIAQSLDSREELLADMDELIDSFLKLLAEVNGVSILDNTISTEDITLNFSGGRTGYILRFQLSTTNGYCNV